MTTLPTLVLGMMLVWTPSLIVLAYFLWRAPFIRKNGNEELADDDDQQAGSHSTKVGVPDMYAEHTALQPKADEEVFDHKHISK